MPSSAPTTKPARRPCLRIRVAAGKVASAVPTTMAAIGSVASPLSGASTAPTMAPSTIEITIAESVAA
jgi:hypothetical protein